MLRRATRHVEHFAVDELVLDLAVSFGSDVLLERDGYLRGGAGHGPKYGMDRANIERSDCRTSAATAMPHAAQTWRILRRVVRGRDCDLCPAKKALWVVRSTGMGGVCPYPLSTTGWSNRSCGSARLLGALALG